VSEREGGCLRVRVKIMGSQKCRNVGKSQSVLVMITPIIIFTRTRRRGAIPRACVHGQVSHTCRERARSDAVCVCVRAAVCANTSRSGPSGLRRAFQFFDSDGSGAISYEELRAALSRLVGLSFEESVMRAAFDDFAEGGGSIDLQKFAHNVLGSRPEDHTSLDSRANVALRKSGNKKSGTSRTQIRQEVRHKAREITIAFRHANTDESGELHVDVIRRILGRLNIDIPDDEWRDLIAKMQPDSRAAATIACLRVWRCRDAVVAALCCSCEMG
jgi:Ca2+-binding EF-hand superfamily protein